MNNFRARSITGAFFVLIMVIGIAWNIWSYIALFSLIALLSLREFYSLIESGEKNIQKIPGFLLSAVLISASFGKYFFSIRDILSFPGIHFIILLFPLYLLITLFNKNHSFKIFSPTLFAILFSVLPFCYLIMFYSSTQYFTTHNNSKIVLGLFFLIWSNDTFAYLIGMAFGKNKLFERISPKKTWEGTLGGMLCTQGIAFILSIYFSALAPVHWFAIAFIVSVTGTLGDLVESMFKRSLGVKDSGSILPGHGGILDRFDGVLMATPFVLSYLNLVQ
jgi:phosphatidate cytidylyltransferase